MFGPTVVHELNCPHVGLSVVPSKAICDSCVNFNDTVVIYALFYDTAVIQPDRFWKGTFVPDKS